MYNSSERKDITNIAIGKYLTFNLNSTGLGWISKTDATKLGLREGHDVIDSAFMSPSTTLSQSNTINFRSSEFSGATQDPYLTVTYTQSATTVTTTTVTNGVVYQYDQSGQRTKKTENANPGTTGVQGKVSIYPNKLYNIENGKIKKHIFAGGNSVATIDDGKIVYHHTDHLSGSSVETDKDGFVAEVLDYYPFGSVRLDTKLTTYENDKKFTGYELDSSGLYYAGQRYYNSETGRFVSVDPVYLAVGMQSHDENGQKQLRKYLGDPQGFNGYSYTRNNPLRYVDPSGEWFKEFFTGQQSWSSFQGELGEAAMQMSPAWQMAMDHPFMTGMAVGVGSGALAYGGAAGLIYLSANYLGGIGLGCAINCPTVAKGLEIGEKFGKLGTVVENVGQRITDYGLHGEMRMAERGLTKTLMQTTTQNPLVTITQDGGNKNLYLTEKAGVVLNKAGQVITTYSNKLFNSEIKSIISKALGK